MKDKIFSIISKVMQIDSTELSDDSSPDTVAAWDSLKHMNLILALEEAFNVNFTDTEIIEMLSVDKIVKTIETRG